MLLKRILFTLLIVYVLLVSATYNGILDPGERLISVMGLAVVVLVWGIARWRGHWQWHQTPLDRAMLVWIAAFALSLAANTESWRRISIGLWYVGAYIGGWYMLQDVFANLGLRRAWLVDALLLAGVRVAFSGYMEIEVAIMSHLPLRPVVTLSNANNLGAFIVLLLPFVAGRLKTARNSLARVMLGFYGAALIGLLGLSFSRGGWIGGVVALAIWAALSLPLRQWWNRLGRLLKGLLILIVLISGLAGAYVIIQSLGISGRGINTRTWIYETALHLFAERPLTGTGLFTFGAGLSRLNSLPPLEPHSHAHNIILHVAAELGIVGLAAVALTGWIILQAGTRIRRPQDGTAIMGLAAFAGFVAHQMFDVPAMMPTIALVALAALVLALPAETPVKRLQRGLPALITLGGVALIVTGLWSALGYRNYYAALSEGVSTGNYRTAADRLLAVVQADPSLAIPYEQRGMMLGLAAAAGDQEAAREGAESFARYVTIEPSYASGWANLAALDEQIGKLDEAKDAMGRAVTLAPQAWSLAYRWGIYAEAAGDTETARTAYQQAIVRDSDIALIPGWDESALRRSLRSSDTPGNAFTAALWQLEAGDAAGAREKWESYSGHTIDYPGYHILVALLAQAQGDSAVAQTEFETAKRLISTPSDSGWVYLAAGLMGKEDFDQAVAAAKSALEIAPTGSDWAFGANIDYIQYLELAIPRKFLPQVNYSEVDLSLTYLLDDADALERLRAVVQH